MNSPAERFKRSKLLSKKNFDGIKKFAETKSYVFDDYQLQAMLAIDQDHSVLLAAPTGSGKTIVAEYGIYKAINQGKRLFYTTPIKALSNQKYKEFESMYGSSTIGLLTGDRRINPNAQIIILTTEILRNMLYQNNSDLQELGWVVMDEVHYLADKFRGSVWEETLILLPKNVNVICLSATVSNVEEFGSWLESIRNQVKVIVHEQRSVPLCQQVFLNSDILDLFHDDSNSSAMSINPVVKRTRSRTTNAKGYRFKFSLSNNERIKIINILASRKQLPAIFFIFSRYGCELAAQNAFDSGLVLTDRSEQELITELAQTAVYNLSDEDRHAVQFDDFLKKLRAGIAAHHAGMLPLLKEIVEELFQQGLIKVVFATETLAVGINMPAKTVVIENLRKFDGVNHVDITAGEFTQLTGRAGRRGIDEIGYSVVVLNEISTPDIVAKLVGNRTYPLISRFYPNYNMTLNLIASYGRDMSLYLIQQSFAQYQTLSKTAKLSYSINELDRQIKSYQEKIGPDLDIVGDFVAKEIHLNEIIYRLNYDRAVRFESQVNDELSDGTVIVFTDSPNLPFVITGIDKKKKTISMISEHSGVSKFHFSDVLGKFQKISKVKIPRGFNPNNRVTRQQIINRIETRTFSMMLKQEDNVKVHALRLDLSKHPFWSIAESDVKKRLYLKLADVEMKKQKSLSKISNIHNNLSSRFDKVLEILNELNYLDKNYSLTKRGRILTSIYLETDLILTEYLNTNDFLDLSVAELGSVLSSFVFEGRTREQNSLESLPTKRVRKSAQLIEGISLFINDLEKKYEIPSTKNVDFGFANPIFDWINQENLELILYENDMAPGDFVRWTRQIIDLAKQIAIISQDEITKQKFEALASACFRGILVTSEN